MRQSQLCTPKHSAYGGRAWASFHPNTGDRLTDTDWNWQLGPIHLGLDGALSQTARAAGFVQEIGRSDGPKIDTLVGIWTAATAVVPSSSGALPPPAVLSVKTFQIVRAVKPTIILRGGSWTAFVNSSIGTADDMDGSNEALNLDPDAPINGILHGRLLT